MCFASLRPHSTQVVLALLLIALPNSLQTKLVVASDLKMCSTAVITIWFSEYLKHKFPDALEDKLDLAAHKLPQL